MQGRKYIPSFLNAMLMANAVALLGLGIGSQMAHASRTHFVQGTIRTTNGPLDVAIQGPGFFKVELDGGEAFTRLGNFVLDADGRLTVAVGDGYRIMPTIKLPDNARGISIAQDGTVFYISGTLKFKAGQLQLTNFTSPDELKHLGHGIYAATRSAGMQETGKPGERRTGSILQGYLEDRPAETFPVQD